jgi:hypothetical protein
MKDENEPEHHGHETHPAVAPAVTGAAAGADAALLARRLDDRQPGRVVRLGSGRRSPLLFVQRGGERDPRGLPDPRPGWGGRADQPEPGGERPEPKTGLQLSADGSTLYFATSRLFQSYDNIFTLPVARGGAPGGDLQRRVIETGPTLSPDGRTLAYFSRTGAGTRILLQDMERPESWPRMLLPEAPPGERSPQFSPDGRHILSRPGGDLWVVEAGGGRTAAGGGGGPRRGERIACVVPRRDPDRLHEGGQRFLPGGDRGRGHRGGDLPHPAPRDHSEVSWAPDGRSVVFVRGTGGHMSQEVVVVAADGIRHTPGS